MLTLNVATPSFIPEKLEFPMSHRMFLPSLSWKVILVGANVERAATAYIVLRHSVSDHPIGLVYIWDTISEFDENLGVWFS